MKRYSLIYPENSNCIQEGDRNFKCHRGDQKLTNKVVSLINKDLVSDVAQKVADLVNNKHISKHIKEVFVDNYVEKIARWAMGRADMTVRFVRSCLQFDKYLDIVVEVPGYSVMHLSDNEEEKASASSMSM